MSFLKFFININLVFIFCFIFRPGFLYAGAFTDMDCFTKNFGTKVSHRGGPMGFFDNILMVTKRNCVLTVSHQRYKFLSQRWIIDVCRGPVHIKYGTKGIDVLKRKSKCLKGAKDGGNFCKSLNCEFMQSLREY